jgi:DNA-directed RNA polymerase sigma subunit (sigma70/sigma32)
MLDRVTKVEALFYLDMINSPGAPNHVSGFFVPKPYYKLLKNLEGEEYKKFLRVYLATKDVLTDREKKVLNCIYGINGTVYNLKDAAKLIGVTPERIRQNKSRGERKIASVLRKEFLMH